MDSKADIIEQVAQARLVETIVAAVAHVKSLTPELKDLSQMVYLALLEKPEAVLQDLWENKGQINYYVARIVINQYCSNSSQFARTYRRDIGRAVEITEFLRTSDNDD